MELIVAPRRSPGDISMKTGRIFEHYSREGEWSDVGGGESYRCWLEGWLFVFRPPAGWTRSWIHHGPPDSPVMHGYFWDHCLGPNREVIGEKREPNLKRLTAWAENRLRRFEQERDTTGLSAVLIVSPCTPPGKQ